MNKSTSTRLLNAVALGFDTDWRAPMVDAIRAKFIYILSRALDDKTLGLSADYKFIDSAVTSITSSSTLQPELSLRSLGVNGGPLLGSTFMALTSSGVPGQWSLKLDSPTTLFLGGIAVHSNNGLDVESDGTTCTVISDGERSAFRSVLSPSGTKFWQVIGDKYSGASKGSVTPSIAIYCSDVPLSATSLSSSLPLAKEYRSKIADDLGRSLEVLSESGTRVRQWVEWNLRGALFVQSYGSSTSGTASDWGGVSFFSHPISENLLALLLVHESAHQACHLLENYVALVAPDCNELCYSSLKKCLRPLDRVLLALHACKHMYSFVRGLEDTKTWSSHWEQQSDELLSNIKEMTSALSQTSGLTPHGKEFVSLIRG